MFSKVISDWIKDRVNYMFPNGNSLVKSSAREGLIQGVEFAATFAEWLNDNYETSRISGSDNWEILSGVNKGEILTTKQLIEKYIIYLKQQKDGTV